LPIDFKSINKSTIKNRQSSIRLRLAPATWLAMAGVLVLLAGGLLPYTFFVGDPGIKLIAARNAIARPTRPLELPLPTIGGEPVSYVDPFFAVHDNHSHAVTPELFPLLTAPSIALLGIRGAYLLPALGFLLALASCAWLAVLLDNRRSPVVVLLAAFFGTPLLFYGLEFWEHALAVGIAGFATVLLVKSATTEDTEDHTNDTVSIFKENHDLRGARFDPLRALRVRAFGCGLLFGVAVLLRPEALWYAVAVLGASLALPRPPHGRALVSAAAGIAFALLPLAAYTIAHFGTFVTPHLAGNPALLSSEWLAIRATIFGQWFGTAGRANFFYVAPAILLAVIPMRGATERRGRMFLFSVSALTVALVFLTAPNGGGGQWGPRYLLSAYLPVAILAADVVEALTSQGSQHMRLVGFGFGRTVRVRQSIGLLVVALVVAGSAWVQRASYRELQGTKRIYARMVDFVAREVPEGGYAVTDLWWLDQIAASLTDSRQMLYVASAEAAADALKRLERAGVQTVAVLRSRIESPEPFDLWLRGTCFTEQARDEIPERTLVAIRIRRTCTL
jgi:hypothetical protein